MHPIITWCIGKEETRQQVMIPCLKEVKSIPIQVQFSSPRCNSISRNNNVGRNFFYWSPNICIQSSLWCIGKEEDWATSHDTLSEGSQKYSNSSLIWLSPVWHPFSCRRRYILTSLEIGLSDEFQKCLESYLVMVPNLLPLINLLFLQTFTISSHVVTLLVATGGSQGRHETWSNKSRDRIMYNHSLLRLPDLSSFANNQASGPLFYIMPTQKTFWNSLLVINGESFFTQIMSNKNHAQVQQ